MGRWVLGDFEWKFAFAEQSSSFGEVLENIATGLESVWVNRYVGTQGEGEKVDLYIENEDALKEFKTKIREFIGKDFKIKDDTELRQSDTKLGDEYWDRVMMRKFLRGLEEGKINWQDTTLYFDVEY